jgi:hypothetical protein
LKNRKKKRRSLSFNFGLKKTRKKKSSRRNRKKEKITKKLFWNLKNRKKTRKIEGKKRIIVF